MKKIENIENAISKMNFSYLFVFAVSCYLSLQLYQTSKPISDFKKLYEGIELYNHRPQEYYDQYRKFQNDSLFRQIKGKIELKFQPLGTRFLNWKYYVEYDKEYIPLRYENYTRIDTSNTVEQIIKILNSEKLVVVPEKIIDCHLVGTKELESGFTHLVTSLNTDSLISDKDTIEFSMQILSQKGNNIDNQVFNPPVIARCRCTKEKIIQDTVHQYFFKPGNWVFDNFDQIKEIKISRFNSRWEKKITDELFNEETKIIGLSVKNESIGMLINIISILYLVLLFIQLSEIEYIFSKDSNVVFDFTWHSLFKNQYSEISRIFNLLLIPILTSLGGTYLSSFNKLNFFAILSLFFVLNFGVICYLLTRRITRMNGLS